MLMAGEIHLLVHPPTAHLESPFVLKYVSVVFNYSFNFTGASILPELIFIVCLAQCYAKVKVSLGRTMTVESVGKLLVTGEKVLKWK